MHSQCHQDIDDLTGLVACLRPWGQGTPHRILGIVVFPHTGDDAALTKGTAGVCRLGLGFLHRIRLEKGPPETVFVGNVIARLGCFDGEWVGNEGWECSRSNLRYAAVDSHTYQGMTRVLVLL